MACDASGGSPWSHRRSAPGETLPINERAKTATDKGVIQGYAGVAAVDAKHQIIVDAQAHDTGSEQESVRSAGRHWRSISAGAPVVAWKNRAPMCGRATWWSRRCCSACPNVPGSSWRARSTRRTREFVSKDVQRVLAVARPGRTTTTHWLHDRPVRGLMFRFHIQPGRLGGGGGAGPSVLRDAVSRCGVALGGCLGGLRHSTIISAMERFAFLTGHS